MCCRNKGTGEEEEERNIPHPYHSFSSMVSASAQQPRRAVHRISHSPLLRWHGSIVNCGFGAGRRWPRGEHGACAQTQTTQTLCWVSPPILDRDLASRGKTPESCCWTLSRIFSAGAFFSLALFSSMFKSEKGTGGIGDGVSAKAGSLAVIS